MIPLQFEPTQQTGSIAIPDEDFLALSDYDGYKGPRKSACLSTTLEQIAGVSRVDFSGHYGAFIHLTIDNDEPAALDKVKRAINDVLPLCRAWAAKPTHYLVSHGDFETGETVQGVSPSDLFEAEESALHNGAMNGERVYAVTAVGAPKDWTWMIVSDDLRDQ